MAAKVEIIYEAEASSLKATINEVNKANDALEKSATDTAKTVADEFKKVGGAAAAAFGGQQVKNALAQLNKESVDLVASLKKLQDEQLKLINAGDRVSDTYKENAAAQEALKKKIAEVNKLQKELNNTYGKTEEKQKTLTGQLRGLKNELTRLEAEGKAGTKQFRELTLAAAQLEDQIGDTRARVANLASDTFKFDAAVQATQGLAAGFEIAQGAAALFGSESEDLNKVIAKTTAVMAIANGVQQIATLLLEESKIKTFALTAAQAIYTTVVGTTTGALKAMRIALAATGVGALVVGLGFLVEKFLSAQAASKAFDEALARSAESAKRTKAAIAEIQNVGLEAATRLKIASGQLTQIEADRQKAISDLTKQRATANADEAKTQKALLTQIEARKNAITQAEIQIAAAQTSTRENAALSAADAQKRLTNEKANLAKLEAEFQKSGERVFNTRVATEKATAAINAEAAFAEQEDAKERAKAASDAAKQAGEKATAQAKENQLARLKIVEEGLKVEAIIEGETVEERIKILENAAEQAKVNAKFDIKNAELRAATIKRIEAELARDIEQVRLNEAKRLAEIKLIELDTLKASNSLTVEQEREAARQRAEIAKAEAESELDPTKRAALLAQVQANLNADLLKIDTDYLKKRGELLNEQFNLSQALGTATLQTEEDFINQSLDNKAEQLKKEASQTVEGQALLTTQLQAVEAERQNSLAKVRAEYANNELELDNLRIETLKALDQDTLDDRIKLLNNKLEAQKNSINAELISDKEKQAKIKKAEAETQEAIRAERKKTLEESIQQGLEFANAVGNAFQSFVALSKQQSEARVAFVQETSAAELEAINKSAASEITKERNREALRLRTERRIASEKTKQAALDKNLALFNAIINTAASITKVLGNPVLVALATAAGAVQIATIASQPVPKFAKGGLIGGRLHSAGGTLIEAERDEYIINRRQSVKHRRELDAINTSSAAFKKLIEERYVRPALLAYAGGRKNDAVIINASLNSKSMERKLDRLNKTMLKQKTVVNINAYDTRYKWQ